MPPISSRPNKPQMSLFSMIKLYLKFIIPIVGLFYLIKKNPFYMSYPAMLPFMVICFIGTIISMIKYSRVTNMMVH